MPVPAVWPADRFLRWALPGAAPRHRFYKWLFFCHVIGVYFGDGPVHAFQQDIGVGQLGNDGFGDFHKYGSFLLVNLEDFYYNQKAVEISQNMEAFQKK